jgi:hypothetical protein
MNLMSTHHPTMPRLRHCLLLLPLLLAALLTVGCSTIPKNGALLAAKLGEGLERNQAETEKIIVALADTQRAILGEKWKPIYKSIEDAYMEKHGVADARDLTHDQRRAIATQSGNVWEKLRGEIDAVEAALKKQSRANTAQLVEINSTIQKYLLSLEKLDASQRAVLGRLEGVTGINLGSLTGLAEKLVSEFQP